MERERRRCRPLILRSLLRDELFLNTRLRSVRYPDDDTVTLDYNRREGDYSSPLSTFAKLGSLKVKSSTTHFRSTT